MLPPVLAMVVVLLSAGGSEEACRPQGFGEWGAAGARAGAKFVVATMSGDGDRKVRCRSERFVSCSSNAIIWLV